MTDQSTAEFTEPRPTRTRIPGKKASIRGHQLNTQKQKAQELEQALIMASSTDHLTGLRSRQWFEDTIAIKRAEAIRHNKNLWLVMIDIDQFKKVNDKLGHATGDKVLRLFGEIGAREEEPIARIGGEEFAQPISNGLTLEDVQKIISRYSENFNQRSREITGKSETISIGLAKLEGVESWESLFQRADKALYESKTNGRNRATLATGGPEQQPSFTPIDFMPSQRLQPGGGA